MAMITCNARAAACARLGAAQPTQLRPVTAFTRAVVQHRTLGRPCRRHTAGRAFAVLDVDEATWDAEVVQAEGPVLIDFWATWCGPCKLVAPSMVWAEKEYAGRLKVVKINCTDSNKSMMERFKVYGLPCLLVFNGGAEVEGSHREGAISRKDLVKYIEKHVGLAPTTPLA